MKITIRRIIDAANKSESIEGVDGEIISAIGAAYWIGQSSARAEEREKNLIVKKNLPASRYHKLVSSVAGMFQSNAVEGLKSEVNEMGSWDYNLKNNI